VAYSCDLVIPCRDEAPALPDLLALVPATLSPVVVDNGSTDGTASVARRLGARVVVEPRRGYGAAVHAGIASSRADLVAVMDGDGSLDPREILQLVAAVDEGSCDLALGRRRPATRQAMSTSSRVANKVAAGWLRRHGAAVDDISPVRVCRRLDVLALEIEDRRFGYPVELLRKAAEAGWQLIEYDVGYSTRAPGTRSKVSGSWPGALYAAIDFVRVLA
jgi:glycosyltransferase involved in cell wall biosynthesis